MSIAWTTVVLLVLLLPGFLFFVGVYAPERIQRDVVQDSAIGRLAGVVLVSFLLHAFGFLANAIISDHFESVPRISLQHFFGVLQLAGSEKYTLAQLERVIVESSFWIFLYISLTSSGGFGAGWLVGKGILGGRLRFFARHAWIYDLIAHERAGAYVHAYVLTNISHEGRILMYRGFLKSFYTTSDGRIAYLVLKDCLRYYLKLEKEAPTTSPEEDWKPIGSSHGFVGSERKQLSYFIIEGEDIANVIFDAYRPVLTKAGKDELDRALQLVEDIMNRVSLEIQTAPPLAQPDRSRSRGERDRRKTRKKTH